MKASAVKGHTLKHARAAKTKHSHTTKHHPAHHAKSAVKHKTTVHAKAKHATHAKARGLALAIGDVACCTAEALGASLRLQGLSVADLDVLDLFRLAGGDDDEGLPILAMLEAASEFGLAGVRLVGYREITPGAAFPSLAGRLHCGPDAVTEEAWAVTLFPPLRAGSILGIDLPGPHTVTVAPGGWLSWGELYCPCEWPGAVIEEAWAVEWAVAA